MTSSAIEQSQSELQQLFAVHEDFCRAMLDAYCLVSASGEIVECNAPFTLLAGVKKRQILKAPGFDTYMTLAVGGSPIGIEALQKVDAPTRHDEIRATNSRGSEFNLIIGIYPFFANSRFLGSWILLRDVTAETNLQGKYVDKATQSVTDHLTGLYNRGYLDSVFEAFRHDRQEDQNAQNAVATMTLAIFDVDFFKKINDTYGHPAGDFILRKIAAVIRRRLRATDTVCRFGGEEFVVVFPSTNAVGGLSAAQKVREAVEAMVFQYEDNTIPVTISGGVAEVKETEDPVSALARADAALYEAKHSGRNRVVLRES